jgi:tetratricopeptide (TPR) repeat protein
MTDLILMSNTTITSTVNPEFVERYQIELEKNPKSRIFAPLAEAYRQMGLLDEAIKICQRGVQIHPEFAGGQLAYARVLIAKGNPLQALTHLEKAVQISPDNLLAQTLLGETYLQLRRPKDALKAFKMVLFINPNDAKALRTVRKWEFLSADEYEEELFKMTPVFETPKEGEAPILEPIPGEVSENEFVVSNFHSTPSSKTAESSPSSDPVLDSRSRLAAAATPWRKKEIERAISLADAYTVRNDLERAMYVLQAARDQLGVSDEIEKRYQLLRKRVNLPPNDNPVQAAVPEPSKPQPSKPAASNKPPSAAAKPTAQTFEQASAKNKNAIRRLKLETLLRRIDERRIEENSSPT